MCGRGLRFLLSVIANNSVGELKKQHSITLYKDSSYEGLLFKLRIFFFYNWSFCLNINAVDCRLVVLLQKLLFEYILEYFYVVILRSLERNDLLVKDVHLAAMCFCFSWSSVFELSAYTNPRSSFLTPLLLLFAFLSPFFFLRSRGVQYV